MSIRTAYRDLDDLQLAGFPLFAEKSEKGNRWKFVEKYKFKVPQPFTFTEVMALHLSKDLFQVFKGTVFSESIETLFEKVQAALPLQTQAYLDRIQSTFHMGIKQYKRLPQIQQNNKKGKSGRHRVPPHRNALFIEEEFMKRMWDVEGM